MQKVGLDAHPPKLFGSLGSKDRYFDFQKLAEITEVVTFNLNRIIDVNYYPTKTARRSNMRHRPVGLGVQGLADVFILLGMPFDSAEVRCAHTCLGQLLFLACWRLRPGALREPLSK